MIPVDHQKPSARLQKPHPAPVGFCGRRQVPEHAPADDQVKRRVLQVRIRHVAQPEVDPAAARGRILPGMLEHLGREVHARHVAAEPREHDAEDPRTAARIESLHARLRIELPSEEALKREPLPMIELVLIVQGIALRAQVPVVANVVRERHGRLLLLLVVRIGIVFLCIALRMKTLVFV